jgi:hypothetical protein
MAYVQHNIFVHCNLPHKGMANWRICIQVKKKANPMPYALSFKCELICRTRRFHYKTLNKQSFHNHPTRNIGDLNNTPSWSSSQNYFWYWLWWPCTKHGDRTSYPCLASQTNYECLLKEVATQMLHLHWRRLAGKEHNEWRSCHNPNSITCWSVTWFLFECFASFSKQTHHGGLLVELPFEVLFPPHTPI